MPHKFTITIAGRPAAKKNRRMLANGKSFPSKEYRAYKRNAFAQLESAGVPHEPLPKPYEIHILAEYNTRVWLDIDNLVTSVFDILEDYRIIENDKFVTKIVGERAYNVGIPEPHVIITIFAGDGLKHGV